MDEEIALVDGDTEASEPDARPETIVVTDPATDRYNTFGFISWWKQDVVRKATAMVVGAGALGNEVLKNLALMGIGRILVVDFDTIDDSNLSRSILFRACDNGRRKAQVAAEAVKELNPDVEVMWLHADVNHDIGLGIYRRMDVVIGCLDNREARLSINKACWKLNKPWIDGAIQELLGIARVFRPNDGACYECTLTEEDYRIMDRRMSCPLIAHQNIVEGKVPTTPTISSIIASVQTQEALKLLHDMEVKSGRALVFNGLNNDVFDVEYALDEDCPSHWVYDEITELKEAAAETMTLRELHNIACAELGGDASLAIPAFMEKVVCTKCDIEVAIMQPRHKLTFEEVHCKECGELMDVASHCYERVAGSETFIDLTLSQVGIPSLDVIPAQTQDWRYRFFELTGDAKSVLKFTKGTPKQTKAFYERRRSWQIAKSE